MVTDDNITNIIEKLRVLRRKQKVSSDDVQFIFICLTNCVLSIRAVAARTVGLLKIKELLPELIDAMSHGGEFMSFPDSVAMFGVEVIPMLEDKLKQKNNITFRTNVAFVLGRLKTDRSIEILRKLAKDASPKVRRVTAFGLSYVAGDKAEKILEELLNKEKDKNVKFFINRAIKSVRDRIKEQTIIKTLYLKVPEFRESQEFRDVQIKQNLPYTVFGALANFYLSAFTKKNFALIKKISDFLEEMVSSQDNGSEELLEYGFLESIAKDITPSNELLNTFGPVTKNLMIKQTNRRL